MLYSVYRHIPCSAVPGAEYAYIFDGDFPNGHPVSYNTDGIVEPGKTPRLIRLHLLQVNIMEIATGNQLYGVMVNLVVKPNPNTSFTLKSRITSPLSPFARWIGDLPNDWGFGFEIYALADLTNTHKYVIQAQFEMREPYGNRR